MHTVEGLLVHVILLSHNLLSYTGSVNFSILVDDGFHLLEHTVEELEWSASCAEPRMFAVVFDHAILHYKFKGAFHTLLQKKECYEIAKNSPSSMRAKKEEKIYDLDVIRTRNLLIWSQTRYRCATKSTCKYNVSLQYLISRHTEVIAYLHVFQNKMLQFKVTGKAHSLRSTIATCMLV